MDRMSDERTRHQTPDPFGRPFSGWLLQAVREGASDVHLIAGHPPAFRLHGDLVELPESPLAPEEMLAFANGFAPSRCLEELREHGNTDFGLAVATGDESQPFRVNLFKSSRGLGACVRVVPTRIPDFEWSGFPVDLARRLAFLRDGLVLVTGATGSGKTTTLAMIVQLLNQAGGYRIITVEEPIEYRFPQERNSIVTQREVGTDVITFADGLKYGLRQDPDVILVGEVRDRDTAQLALSAAETGHLVFTTLHTRDAKGAITRYSDLFPSDAQRDVRAQLSLSLRAIVSQRLLPNAQSRGKRHLALEVLWNTFPIAAAIRTAKVESIDNYLLTARNEGMVSFDESVRRLFQQGKITRDVAIQNVRDIPHLDRE